MLDSYASLTANWSYPTAIRFGAGRIGELAEAVNAAGITRPLFVTDPGIAGLPIVAKALAVLDGAGVPYTVFSKVDGNPTLANLDDGLAAYRAGNHDGVVAFGGGSAMDIGKTIAFIAGQTRPVWDFEDREDWWTRADANGIAPIVAVPTTAGTGSEVGRAAVITDPADHTKKIIFHPKMQPRLVIEDPELTVGLPPKITAWTGMDALSHSLEAWSSPFFHPMSQGIALEGMRLVKEWLPVAVTDGSRIEARAYMLIASSMGAVAFQKGLGAMHAMSHPCSSLRGTHHGLTNAVVMPYVLAFNAPAISEKLAALARYLDLPGHSASSVIDWVLALRAELGIPHTLKEIGVDDSVLPEAAKMAEHDPSTGGNPVKVGVAEYETLFRRAIEGTV
ncbi:iron-containing alcohol dehydrogenase [Kaistia geumhonensis]|uniref:Alcohol dehydrogenase class IV n=1 Tax=Kaistia geumhonensis TaxID=410839 RepID=A0ABU0MB20_9HYPH|nr:iron-containing alcohol dehydrogenase [Kaistia geumhonensis]MCX5481108.1 iron-containing alcohol dehydrogenase [Kaistia geumhonensis]MDQ0518168.1 alcohol dehydrogenase class IV [Kaistia geumhonensis]